ncbi:MAG: rod shape-determining protein MreC [Aphanocapsa lilacina HA4352-LM1]|nr:rod shape-determining protein MreC [Aphanocapsa lilacina HA4352-LM1]
MVERLRRWWIRFGLAAVAALLALGLGWWMRQSGGALIADLFGLAAAPFVYAGPTPTQKRDDRASQMQGRLEALYYENRELRSLLELEEKLDLKTITAQVIGRSADHWWQGMVVNRGGEDGVKVGSSVLSDGGAVVGQVSEVSARTSRVLLLSDPGSQVGVMAVRPRLMGILQGRRREQATVEFFEQQPLKPGELIVTSGLSSRFPAGLPVGRVVGFDKNQAVPRVKITFLAPIGRLEWVKIYPGEPAVKIEPPPPPPPPPVAEPVSPQPAASAPTGATTVKPAPPTPSAPAEVTIAKPKAAVPPASTPLVPKLKPSPAPEPEGQTPPTFPLKPAASPRLLTPETDTAPGGTPKPAVPRPSEAPAPSTTPESIPAEAPAPPPASSTPAGEGAVSPENRNGAPTDATLSAPPMH